MTTLQASDMKITEGFITETKRRIERLSDIENPTNHDITNLEAACAEVSAHKDTLRQICTYLTGKPGPPKLFPRRMNLRMSDTDAEALSNISEKTGEDNSEIIRRLIHKADAK